MKQESYRYHFNRISQLVNHGAITPEKGLEAKEALLKEFNKDRESTEQTPQTTFYCCLDCMIGYYSKKVKIDATCPKCKQPLKGSMT